MRLESARTSYIFLFLFGILVFSISFNASAIESMQFTKVLACNQSAISTQDQPKDSNAGNNTKLAQDVACLNLPPELENGTIILASGHIDRDSVDKLSEFTQNLLPHTIIVLQSLGGDLIGGLRLGQFIRARGFYTFIANSNSKLYLDKKFHGKCFSACAYAFLGGVKRKVEIESQYGVHQFRGSNVEINSVQTQKLSAVIGRYIDSMGVNRQLLDQALLTEPGKMQIISQNLLRAWQIENVGMHNQLGLARWRIDVTTNGKRLAFVSQKQTNSSAILVFALVKIGDQVKALLIVRPDPIEEGKKDWPLFFSSRISLFIELEPVENKASNRVFQLSAVSDWQSAGVTNTIGTRQIWFDIPPFLLVELQTYSQFYLKPNWQVRPRGFDDKTVFGTIALKEMLMAL